MTRRDVWICASTFILICVFFVTQPTILESAAPRSLRDPVPRRAVLPRDVGFDTGDAGLMAQGSSSPIVSASCADAPTTPESCRFFLDASVLPPKSVSNCLPASTIQRVALPWSVIVCGDDEDNKGTDDLISSSSSVLTMTLSRARACTFSKAKDGRQHVTAKTALIGIHGGPGQSSAIIRDLVRLSSSAMPVILYDQRGAGRSAALPSPAGDDIDSTMRTYVDELREVLRQFGVEKAHLVGHSFGAAIAIRFAHTHPELTATAPGGKPTLIFTGPTSAIQTARTERSLCIHLPRREMRQHRTSF